ncbi:unnamed protein product [Echinostoma caproni]|uniref:Secreted protein n=1 Tax=Echinostoma caproni TaxID=27848 RepID=A0A183BCI0_9TREM|nr:unnamed protein product [Echinostoma caproni]
MLTTFRSVVLSVHSFGRILELTVPTYPVSQTNSRFRGPVYWCLSSSLLTTDVLHAGAHVVLHNIWYLPIPTWAEISVGYEALLVLGVYSTCQLIKSDSSVDQIASCGSRCCADPRLIQPESLYPINVRSILSSCLNMRSLVLPAVEVSFCSSWV